MRGDRLSESLRAHWRGRLHRRAKAKAHGDDRTRIITRGKAKADGNDRTRIITRRPRSIAVPNDGLAVVAHGEHMHHRSLVRLPENEHATAVGRNLEFWRASGAVPNANTRDIFADELGCHGEGLGRGGSSRGGEGTTTPAKRREQCANSQHHSQLARLAGSSTCTGIRKRGGLPGHCAREDVRQFCLAGAR